MKAKGRQPRLPSSGGNIFIKIKEDMARAREKGVDPINLSVGVPLRLPLDSTIKGIDEALHSGKLSLFEYQDNGCAVRDFAKRAIQAHLPRFDLNTAEGLAYMPIPGIKSMLGLILLACGPSDEDPILVGTMGKPGYGVIDRWCEFLGKQVVYYNLPLNRENGFRFSIKDIKPGTDVIFVNYPNNPTGRILTRDEWYELCEYCQAHNIRLVNDAAYSLLAFDPDYCNLIEVAALFPQLSFLELFSSSKEVGNGTGLRVGAVGGSFDFVGDLAKIKGDSDSGLCALNAAGVICSLEEDQEGIAACREMYRIRIEMLVKVLERCGLRLIVYPKAGFFIACEVPNEAFGKEIADAMQFYEELMKLGIFIVPLGTGRQSIIRFAVTGPVETNLAKIESILTQANISYAAA
jgi:aspartate/methionine/tyrosine aminotransferase